MPRLALAAALAGLLVTGAVVIFARPTIGPGNPTAPPSALPSTAVTPSNDPSALAPTPTPTLVGLVISPADVGRSLVAGTYRVPGFAAPFTITLPSDGKISDFTTNSIAIESVKDSRVNIYLAVIENVYPDPCHSGEGATFGGYLVDDLVAAFSSMPGFEVADLTDATVGGAPGKAFTLSNSVVTGNCSSDKLPLGTYRNRDGTDADITVFGGESDLLWVLDAGGTRVVIAITNTPEIVGASRPLLDDISFDITSVVAPQVPTSTQFERSYSSEWNGVTISYPAGWLLTPASVAWVRPSLTAKPTTRLLPRTPASPWCRAVLATASTARYPRIGSPTTSRWPGRPAAGHRYPK